MNSLHPACKVTLVRKTSAKCDFSQAMLSIAYKLNCTLQSEMHDVTVRRHAHSSGEYASEVEGTAPCYSSERGEALAAGIINRVAPEGRHLEVAYELAAEVAKNPPLSVRVRLPRFSGRFVSLQSTSWSWRPACRLRRLSVSGIPGPNATAPDYTNPRCS